MSFFQLIYLKLLKLTFASILILIESINDVLCFAYVLLISSVNKFDKLSISLTDGG